MLENWYKEIWLYEFIFFKNNYGWYGLFKMDGFFILCRNIDFRVGYNLKYDVWNLELVYVI